ncbi:unnamed protein product [Kuraishia capsulata CBS 1993]|uniref:Vacuolar protein sorting-associated protein n=1 Tax=Kuraishia capsulata CBS 1993 TaxID=1382522 RepID=W6MFE6_9ASCO|nr:uncharacterized protein KUCA_T00000467001 [Kuraishia capsulata CBS 1993]CDK24504.1 unnamed protein product [Kuraishia capsulata CBS 1993]
MLESLVASLLNRTLGSYVENFDPKQLNIGIWGGDVKLRDLRLKKESFDKFEIPLDIKFGHMGELTLQIPWSNLKSKPVKIIVENVYLLCVPATGSKFDPDAEQLREQRLKRQKLEELELIQQSTPAADPELTDEESLKNESFTESLVTKIVDNLQFTIKNIHVRYEDDHAFTDSPYAVGMTLGELSAVSADESWIPNFISGFSVFARKLMTLNSLTCYLDSNTGTIFREDPVELLQVFQDLIEKNSSSTSETQFILKPVSGTGHLTVNKQGATEAAPHIHSELYFDEFSVDLNSDQYRDVLTTASRLHQYTRNHRYRKFRPQVSVSDDPSAWMTFVAKCIQEDVHEKNKLWTWNYIKEQCELRTRYIALWRSNISKSKVLSVAEKSELESLENALTFEQISLYRALARRLNRKSAIALSPAEKKTESEAKPQQPAGWFGWWSGAKPATDDSTHEDLTMTDEQKKELYEAIEYNEEKVFQESIDIPKDRVKTEVRCNLKRGALAIRKHKGDSNLGEIVFEGCEAKFLERPDSFVASFQLHEFRVEDGTENTLYKHTVSVKPLHYNMHGDSQQSGNSEEDKPFFDLTFEKNPLDGSADSALNVSLTSTTIFHNPKFIEEVFLFFRPPRIHSDTIGMIMNAAESTIEGFTQQTRLGLQYAIEEHKTINCKMDLQAPLIIVPLDPTNWSSPVAILDAGHIKVASDLADPKTIEEIEALTTQSGSENLEKLNSLMYDRFDLKLEDAQILIGPDVKSTIEQLHATQGKSTLILDNFSMDFLLQLSIVPSAYNLPRMKIGGKVPRFRASLSDVQYKVIMKLIDAIIPNFDLLDETENSQTLTFGSFGAHDHLLGIDENEDVGSDVQSVTKQPTTAPSDAASKQHQIEFDFSVDSIVLSLSRCVDTSTFQSDLLIDLVGDRLKLDFYKTATEMHLDLLLADISIDDHIEQSGPEEFKKLISSNNFEDYDGVVKKDDIFSVEYQRSQRLVPYNGSEIEVFDQDVTMSIADVKLVVTRKSLLTLLNFALNTFTDPNAPETPADQLRHNDEQEEMSPQKINVKINLESVILVLNDDGIKLATMKLSQADVEVYLLPEKMKVLAKLGGLSLHDEVNEGSSRDSIMRNLISIEGEELAELHYETFDVAINKEDYNSLISFHTGSIKINYVEHPFNRILAFLSQFQRMKYIYDRAREAALNQAGNIDGAGRMRFDILIKTPIIVFPRIVDPRKDIFDRITFNLGEIYLNNKFEKTGEDLLNMISMGMRSTKMSSELHFENYTKQSLEIIDGLDIGFNINYCDVPSVHRPTMIVTGDVTGKEIALTELQVFHLMKVAQTIPSVLNGMEADESLTDLEEDAENANLLIDNRGKTPESVVSSPEDPSEQLPADHVKLELDFNIPKLGMTLYNDTKEVVSNINDKTLSRFSLNDTGVTCELREDGNFKVDLHIKSFTVEDIRKKKDNRFTELIPEVIHDNYQFKASAYSEGSEKKRHIYSMLEIDSPRVILALDYLFSLKSFVDVALNTQEVSIGSTRGLPSIAEEESVVSDEAERAVTVQSRRVEEPESPDGATTYGFSLNVVDSSLILLADPSNENSEAIVFKIGQVLMTSQNIQSLSAVGVGIFLCRMSSFDENRLRVIDDFSASMTIDSRNSTPTRLLTSIDIKLDPLLVRVSLRDIRLALTIFNRASEMYKELEGIKNAPQEGQKKQVSNFSEDFKRKLSKYAPSILSSASGRSKKSAVSVKEPQVVIHGESLEASFEGLRLVLIGDVHELPVLDMEVKPFSATARNWSTDLEAHTNITSLVNIFNYSTSTWEPLLEPWSFGIHVSKAIEPKESMIVEIFSRDTAELTFSSRSVALMSHISTLLHDSTELKPRDQDSPFRILNETGFDINIWIDEDKSRRNLTHVKNGENVMWHFQDWRKVRETLRSESESGFIGCELLDSSYNPIESISLKAEGEELFVLNPRKDGIHNRLACTIKLGEDKVKYVTLRSTLKIKNTTQTPIYIGNGVNQETLEAEHGVVIPPGDEKSVPIDYVYSAQFAVRPLLDDELYGWSSCTSKNVNKKVSLFWKDLLDHEMVLECPGVGSKKGDKYFLQATAEYDELEPLAKIYPHMTVTISSPLVIENLLPFDLSAVVSESKSKGQWSRYIEKGCQALIHSVDLKNLLTLRVTPVGSQYRQSASSIINVPEGSPNSISTNLKTESNDGHSLFLKIHYNRKHGGVKLTVYVPYLVLNRTGKTLYMSERYNVMTSKVSDLDGKIRRPDMFSFEHDSKTRDTFGLLMGGNLRDNTAVIKIGDSLASNPISIDKIGQSFELRIPLKERQLETILAIHISEGEGKYNLTKVINVIPKYIVRNNLEDTIQITLVGLTKTLNIEPGQYLPVYELPRVEDKQLRICFLGSKSEWSAPFPINDVGEVYLRVLKQGLRSHKLLRISTATSEAGLYININDASDHWPFSIRNFSDQEFLLFQSDPDINDDGVRVSSAVPFKRVYYRIPPKSSMPYAWDFPAGLVKDLVLKVGTKERHIQLAEIGELEPMLLPTPVNSRQRPSVDLKVIADGPTQCLVISNYDSSTSLYQRKTIQNSTSSIESDKFEALENDSNYFHKVILKFEGIGISLINQRGQELVYVNVRGIEFHYNESEIYQNLSIKLKWIQIDNQLYGSVYPIVLYPSVVAKSSKEMNEHPTFSASVSRVKDDTHGVLYIKQASLLLQELSVEIDEDFLFALIDFSKIPGAPWNKQISHKLWDENLEIPEPPEIRSSNDLYFEWLNLQPLEINLSFVRTEHINAEDTAGSQDALVLILNVLTMAIGNINDAPIRLSALLMNNVRVPLPYLLQNIQEHYTQAFLYQLYKVLGSADVLGNPVGLFNTVSSGVFDIFYEPYHGFIMTDRPQELGIGLAKGGLSFLKKSVFGFSDSFARITGSVAKGLTVATLDKDFQERRRVMKQRNKPNHALYGFSYGASSLIDGLTSGITGMATAPAEGAEKEGAAGFFKGVGKGLIGLPTKTATGLFDFASSISEGIRNTTTAFDGEALSKVRLPRYVPITGAVVPYSEREAQGQFWLKSADGGKYFDDTYLAHVVLPGGELCLIISLKHIMIVSIVRMTMEWMTPYEKIANISLEKSGIMFRIKNRPGVNGMFEKFIPIPENNSKRYIYQKIATGVGEYNKHCQVFL